MKKLLKFLISGGTGFLVDAGITMAMLHYEIAGPFLSRAVAIVTAMAVTWYINRNFTFGASRQSLVREGFRYSAIGVTSAALNYALYAALIGSAPHLQPLVAVVFASAAAMAYSYFGYSRFVFGR